MKITKEIKTVTEEIEVKAGTYYFEDEEIVAHKFTLEEPQENYSEYKMETLFSNSNRVGIIIREDGAWDGEDLPYKFSAFIKGVGGKEITKEEFYKEKQEVLNRL